MAYLGVQPTAGQYRKLDDISGSFNGSTVTFTTQVGGQNVTAGSAQSILVSLGGVVQSPGVDYTVSTNSITFTTAPASGLSFFAILMGEAINIGTPADGSVTGAKLSDPFNFDSGTLYLDGANNRVGIGTTSPSALLNLKITGAANASTTDALILDNDNSNSNDDLTTSISWKRTGNDASQIFARIGSIRTGTYDTALAFSVNNGGTLSERVRLDTSGRLLVGTSSAVGGAKLQVSGNATDEPALMQFRYANNNPNSGTTIGQILFVDTNAANGQYATITCAADAGTGSADFPGRLVFSTTADGASSPTERARITNGGYLKASNNTAYNDAAGSYHEFGNNANAITVLMRANNSSFSQAVLRQGCYRAANSAYQFLAADSGDGSTNPFNDTEFNLRGDGTGLCDGSWTGGGADYAEYFEWSDGNPDEEDRRGISVVLDGDQIRPAVDGEDPIGVISGNPSVVGDAAWNKWVGKYLRDDYGSYILDAEGYRQLNPAYDPDQEYVPREQRPEWDCVGLMGKLRIRKGQPTGSRWIKMRDISDSVEEWLVR